MSREVRSRVVLGIGIPLAAAAFLAAMIFAFSRILLATPEEPNIAPWVALAFAGTIMAGCALAAMVQGTKGFVFIIALLVLTIVGGGVAGAVLGQREIHSLVPDEHAAPGEGAPPEGAPVPGESPPPPGSPAAPPPPPEGGVTVVAQASTFNTSQLSLRAEGEVAITLQNQDPVPHNLSIYTEQGGDVIFQETPQPGPATIQYRFPAPPPGEYYFQCDVHPTTMFGQVTVG